MASWQTYVTHFCLTRLMGAGGEGRGGGGVRVCQRSPRAALMQKRVHTHTQTHTLVFQSAPPPFIASLLQAQPGA